MKGEWKRFLLSDAEILGAFVTKTPVFYINEKKKALLSARIDYLTFGDGELDLISLALPEASLFIAGDEKRIVDKRGALAFAEEYGMTLNL